MMPQLMPDTPSAWLPYVAVEDIDAATKKAKNLGAKIMKDVTEVMGRGWLSIIVDPTGAMREAAQLARNFGISAAIDSAETIRQLKSDVEDTRTHALGVFTAIGRRFHGYRASMATIAGLVLVLLAALVLGWGVDWLDQLKGLNLPRFSGTGRRRAGKRL